MDTAQITPPWGYKQIVPLLKTHRVQLVDSGMAPHFSLNLHAVPLGASELAFALRDYPIVFQQRKADGGFEAVALLGIQEGQNLFVMPDGRWDRRTYIPAYIRRYPFCVHTVRHDSRPAERLIYVDPWSLADNGTRLFDDAGVPLPHWVAIDRLLNEYEDELTRVNRLAAVLHGLGGADPVLAASEPVQRLHAVPEGPVPGRSRQACRARRATFAPIDRIRRHGSGVCPPAVPGELPAADEPPQLLRYARGGVTDAWLLCAAASRNWPAKRQTGRCGDSLSCRSQARKSVSAA